ncbi:hypothetical protein DPMN_069634 [Dreissena polymorpha]|uniref:Uncharacterized protein n=1 Tax=Dreissena polymorpha TaxID=45954 RepID=A0A9D4BUI6_DREPO|nr:hypothetical protein DPMN_069634 [Dreissena polymorpha]
MLYLLPVTKRVLVSNPAVDISPKDPRWLGAWWLGFLVFGGFALIFSVPTMCFPRYLKSKKRKGDLVVISKERRLQRETQVSVWKALFLEMKGMIFVLAFPSVPDWQTNFTTTNAV